MTGGRDGAESAGLMVRAMRPHQWSKNALVLVPAFAAQLALTGAVAVRLTQGLVAFSLVASAGYLINDLVDRPYDRVHPTKRHRPIPAGRLPVWLASGMIVGLLALAAVVCSRLPPGYVLALVAYFAIAIVYSLVLKRHLLVDAIALATMYGMRLIAGAALVDVRLSRWFLAFAVFFFLSLSLVKRVAELTGEAAADDSGRAYRAGDVPFLVSFGSASVAASGLVYSLYITGDEVRLMYDRPDLLWIGLPVLLYWQSRMWLTTTRGAMTPDPLVYALKDRASYVCLLLGVAATWLAR